MFVGMPAGLAFIYLFPTGRAAPRWLGWAGAGLPALFFLLALATWLFPAIVIGDDGWLVFVGIIAVLLAHALYALFFLRTLKGWIRMAIAAVFALSGVAWWLMFGGGA